MTKAKSPAERTAEFRLSSESNKLVTAFKNGGVDGLRAALKELALAGNRVISAYGRARKSDPNLKHLQESEKKFMRDVINHSLDNGIPADKLKIASEEKVIDKRQKV